MDNNTPMISYAAHEGMMARMERTIRRLCRSLSNSKGCLAAGYDQLQLRSKFNANMRWNF